MTAPDLAAAIAADVPCERCGYNLRGLQREGQCPECGLYARFSVETWEGARAEADIGESDRAFIVAMMEGLTVALVAFVLMIVLAAGPMFGGAWMLELKSPQRAWTLGIAVTMFVLSCLAAWKLSTPDLRGGYVKHNRASWLLRMTTVAYLIAPFLKYFEPIDVGMWLAIPLILILMIAACTASVYWFLVLARLARRCGRRMCEVQARVLAAIVIFPFIFSLLPELDGASDSLSMMYRYDLIQFGSAEALREFCVFMPQGHYHPFILAMAVLPLWSAVLSSIVLVSLIKCLRQSPTTSSASRATTTCAC